MIDFVNDHINPLKELCKKHNVKDLYLFGSAVSSGFNNTSDLDFAVVFKDSLSPLEHGSSFFNLKHDLENLFAREVDLISYRVIKNPIFKEELDQTKVTLYAA